MGASEHRHVPEVLQHSGLGEREFTFTAQLLPVTRGILETIYIRTHGLEKAVDLLSIYEEAYAGEPFVRLYAPGKVPDLRGGAAERIFATSALYLSQESQRAMIVAAEDNLSKGRRRTGCAESEPAFGHARNRGPAVKVLIKVGRHAAR